MPSPFPGVDPYFEAPHLWEEVHWSLAAEMQAQLQPQLVPRYIAALNPHIAYTEPAVPTRMQSIHIQDVASQAIVTVIELRAPLSKLPSTETLRLYQQHCADLLESDVHLLELDLLRRGIRWPTRDALPAAHYFVFLSRANRRSRVEVWPLTFREPPVPMPVPLRPPDRDVTFDLAAALARVYEIGAFALRVDYQDAPPMPELGSGDARWLDERLRVAGLR